MLGRSSRTAVALLFVVTVLCFVVDVVVEEKCWRESVTQHSPHKAAKFMGWAGGPESARWTESRGCSIICTADDRGDLTRRRHTVLKSSSGCLVAGSTTRVAIAAWVN